MKLDSSCVRDLLLYLEDNLSYTNTVNIQDIELKSYDTETLLYTAEKLEEAKFINCVIKSYVGYEIPVIIVKSLSYNGHQFLDSIRDNQVWSKTKSIASKIGIFTIDGLKEIAINVISESIKAQFN